jgi:hypothetical protein
MPHHRNASPRHKLMPPQLAIQALTTRACRPQQQLHPGAFAARLALLLQVDEREAPPKHAPSGNDPNHMHHSVDGRCRRRVAICNRRGRRPI